MLHFLPAPLMGVLTALLIFLNTLVNFFPLILIAVVKLVIPVHASREACTRAIIKIASFWIGINNAILNYLHAIDVVVEGEVDLHYDQWYMVTSNHQSWADIPILQSLFNWRIPMLKFFLKQELIWVPLLGLAWWALDFPFMKRYSKAFLAKHPELKGKDMETTRRACEKFRYTPVSIFNFMEGTRFTPEKQRYQQSPYQHLLQPRAGGLGFVMGALGTQVNTLVNATILYPDGDNGFWSFLCGRVKRVVVHVEVIRLPDEFIGKDYMEDQLFREQFQLWVRELWAEKDARLTDMKERFPPKADTEPST